MIQDAIKIFYSDNPIPNPINITLTQKQIVDGQRIDDAISETNFKHFSSLLNRQIFGNAYKRHNRKLAMLVVRECGAWHRHHIHAIIEKPTNLSTDEFMAKIIECWMKTDFGYREYHYEEPIGEDRKTGWINYCFKRRTKADVASSIDWTNSTCFECR